MSRGYDGSQVTCGFQGAYWSQLLPVPVPELKMISRMAAILAGCIALAAQADAKECWTLTKLNGQMAFSKMQYAFLPDGYSSAIVLCFNDDGTGTVTGENTKFVRFGESTLIGWATDEDNTELAETYQIDKVGGKVLFSKTRVGPKAVLGSVVGSFVGEAARLKD